MAKSHLAGFEKAGAAVTAVCDSNRQAGQEVADACGARFFGDYRDLLASGSVDAVDVMLPHHLHEQVGEATLAAGLHLLMEKPASRSAFSIEELQVLAESRGVVFAVAENTRSWRPT